MTNRDRVRAHENFLHQQSQDLLTLSHLQGFGADPQLASKRRQVFRQTQVLGVLDGGHLQRL
jgi:hypothetical protein